MLFTVASSLLVAGCSAPQDDEVERAPDVSADELLAGQTLRAFEPTSDTVKTNVTGVGDVTSLYADLDEGTSFPAADDTASYVTGTTSATVSSLTSGYGYAGASTQAIVQVTVRYRAATRSGSTYGCLVSASVADGARVLANGGTHAASTSWSNFTDTFTVNVSRIANLRTTLRLTHGTASDAGSISVADTTVCRVTSLWVEVVTQAASSDGGTEASVVPDSGSVDATVRPDASGDAGGSVAPDAGLPRLDATAG